jgi:hypothetical protein
MMKPWRMKWAVYVALNSEDRNVYKLSVGRPGGKRLRGRCGLRLEQMLKRILKKQDWGEDVDWTCLA